MCAKSSNFLTENLTSFVLFKLGGEILFFTLNNGKQHLCLGFGALVPTGL